MGVALADTRSETIVGFVTLTDRDKFRGLLDKVSKGALVPVLEDRGLVLKANPDSDSAVVLRDRFAFFVATDHPSRRTTTTRARWRRSTRRAGWPARRGSSTAMASDEPARPLTGYVDAWGLIDAEYSQSLQDQDREPSWAESELERAQTTGAPQEELERLRRQVDDDRRWQEQRRQKRQTQHDVLSRWFRDVGPMVFEFTADKAGVSGRVRAKMPETSLWRAMVRNAATPSPVLLALAERPVAMIGGSLDVVATKAALEDLMRADGGDPAKEYAEFKAETSIDPERDLAPILSGSGGFAMTVSDALLRGEYKQVEQEMGFAAAVGVTSPQRAQAIVDAAVQRVPRAKLGRERKTGAHILEIADYRPVYATVVAGHIVVTTDLGVIQRMSTGSQGSLAKVVVVAGGAAGDRARHRRPGHVRPVLPGDPVHGRRSSSPTIEVEEPYSCSPTCRARRSTRSRSRGPTRPSCASGRRTSEDPPRGGAGERRQTKTITAVADAIGVQAYNLREQPDGLVLAGGHYFGKGGLTRAIDLGATTSARARRREDLRAVRRPLGPHGRAAAHPRRRGRPGHRRADPAVTTGARAGVRQQGRCCRRSRRSCWPCWSPC
jgi:hypothetical protein